MTSSSTPPRGAFTPTPPAVTLTDLGGVRAAGVAAGIKASGKPDVALLVFDGPISCAASFTQNAFAAAPVLVCREHLEKSGGLLRALIVNAGNANACTGDLGMAHARAMVHHVAAKLGCPVEQVLVASTGVIGVPLPIERVLEGADRALASLGDDAASARRFLEAIMTTDSFQKEAGEVRAGGREAGVAKGAGMIEPNMATMISIAGTTHALTPAELKGALPAILERSFNAIHVDSHASTNDSFFLFATGSEPADGAPVAREPAIAALSAIAERLAWLIARDGEGATKVTTIDVAGAKDDASARDMARRVAHSALVRTALYGNDPNWGRFVSAVGNSPLARDVSRLSCTLQGIRVFERGQPTAFDRRAASCAMASSDDLRIELDLHDGPGRARVLTSDLGYRYVEVNAEYTT
ncbi:MAG: bifunctional glutamate N-acetyltransferase/amino-acid acetyltransferase ArgJ [Polyangiaceae bacterium]|nr:bifunctional glutamate N-acetyltransferase/amino-acid acetyltransferase ArgJ [Polyangiaceae bacterium]MBK8939053.1 bifunctional glutamate N-acetyltransferase/amino-acid acetyltransferase ArgJ [Polyangiaceae bacterium]